MWVDCVVDVRRGIVNDSIVMTSGMVERMAVVVLLCCPVAAVALASSAMPGHTEQHESTCDFRLAESTRYSSWTAPLHALGVSANTTLNVNGEFLGSGEWSW